MREASSEEPAPPPPAPGDPVPQSPPSSRTWTSSVGQALASSPGRRLEEEICAVVREALEQHTKELRSLLGDLRDRLERDYTCEELGGPADLSDDSSSFNDPDWKAVESAPRSARSKNSLGSLDSRRGRRRRQQSQKGTTGPKEEEDDAEDAIKAPALDEEDDEDASKVQEFASSSRPCDPEDDQALLVNEGGEQHADVGLDSTATGGPSAPHPLRADSLGAYFFSSNSRGLPGQLDDHANATPEDRIGSMGSKGDPAGGKLRACFQKAWGAHGVTETGESLPPLSGWTRNVPRGPVRGLARCISRHFTFDPEAQPSDVPDAAPRASNINFQDYHANTTMMSLESSPNSTRLKRIVVSTWFETLSLVLVVANSLMLGVQANTSARNVGQTDESPVWVVLQVWFCILFTGELVMRMCVYGCSFFTSEGWKFNVLDTVLVILQMLELGAQAFGSGGIFKNFNIFRIARIARLVRVVRICRVLKHVRELRTLISSIAKSVKALVWTFLLLLLMVYISSLLITQMVFEKRQDIWTTGSDVDIDDLVKLYGDLLLCMLTLYEALFGGQDWDVLMQPLRDHLGDYIILPFCFYIGFGSLALMNAVTGIFVENVLKTTKKSEEEFLINNVRELFERVPNGIRGTMAWHLFESLVDSPQMQEAFHSIEIPPSDAKRLFKLLDTNGSGRVNATEFVNGILRLRGPARALDLAFLALNLRKMETRITHHNQHASLHLAVSKTTLLG